MKFFNIIIRESGFSGLHYDVDSSYGVNIEY